MGNKALCRWTIGLCVMVAAAFAVSSAVALGGSSGSIGDFVWRDTNFNGIQDAGEPGIKGVKLTLLPASPGGDLGVFTDVTDDEGHYVFDNLPTNASYRVSVDASNFETGGALAGLYPTLPFRGTPDLDSDGAKPVVTLSPLFTATADLDFGFGPCATCSGGASSLALRYVGSKTGTYLAQSETIAQTGPISPGEVIFVEGPTPGAPLGPALTLYINSVENAVIDTSCECCSPQPVRTGDTEIDADLVRDILGDIGTRATPPGSGSDLDRDGLVTVSDLNTALNGESSVPPPAAPIVLGDTILVQENFEGAAVGWGFDGLWHTTDGCKQKPVCDGARWAYFGMDNTCNYATGAYYERGFITSPEIVLPEASGCGALKLSYCSFLKTTGNNVQGQAARVLCNGQVVQTVTMPAALKWRTESIDLTAFAGQTVRLQWEFETRATSWHRKLGWQVDNIVLTRSEAGTLCVGPGVRIGDFEVFSGTSAAGLLCEHSVCCGGEVNPAGACCLADGTCAIFPTGPDCVAAGGAFFGPNTTCEDCDCNSRLGACCTHLLYPWDSTQICIQATYFGCVSGNVDLDPDLEYNPNGVFLGLGVACSSAACNLAACCLEDVGICTMVPPSLCESLYGRSGPLNSDCGDIVCIPKGACCLYNGYCRQQTETECRNNFGIYKGNYTRCGEVYCPPVGACCYGDFDGAGTADAPPSGGCIVVAQWYCEQVLNGWYKGNNMPCTDSTCLPTGACCLPLGLCHSNLTQAECTHLLGIWRGVNTSCSTAKCDTRGACCLDAGGCVPLTVEASCVRVLKGAWHSGLNCNNAGCPPVGACCLPNGDCSSTTRVNCDTLDGIYKGDYIACLIANCGQTRACCLPAGGCTVTTKANCENVLGGTYISNRATCANAGCAPPSTGACCNSNPGPSTALTPSCVDNVSQSNCSGPGQAWFAGALCSSNPCPATGRCCITNDPSLGPASTCLNGTTSATCQNLGGSWGGAGSNCASNPCTAPTGRCCIEEDDLTTSDDVDCVENQTQQQCQQAGGQWGGAGSTCQNSQCDD